MKYPLLLIIILTFAFSLSGFSQNKFTLSGSISDGSNGEDLIGAMVRVKEKPNMGAISNVYGFYSIDLPAGKYTFIYTYVGFQSKAVKINLTANTKKNIELKSSSKQIQGVEITGERSDANVTSTEMSVSKVSLKEVEKIPVIFGERDIMKTVQLLPGIKSEGDGGAGFFVRGGSADQNLILLDEAPVYNASHMMGFFSIFNSDALKDVKLYKGGMPAQYGGRLSSVMDIKMKEGNSKGFHASGGVGLISSKLSIEGPIVKDKGFENFSVYSASKAAVRSFARSWANDLKSRKIRVNSISPGPIETPIFSRMGMSEEELNAMGEGFAAQVPLGRFGQPEEIAKTALFLASDGSFVNGHSRL